MSSPPVTGFPIELAQLKRPAPTNRFSGEYVVALLGLFLLLVSSVPPLLLVRAYAHSRDTYRMFTSSGRTVTGSVSRIKSERDEDGYRELVCYRYPIAPASSKVELEACDPIHLRDSRRFHRGDPMEVIYFIDQPEVAIRKERLHPPSIFEDPVGFAFGAFFFVPLFGGGLFLLWLGGRGVREHVRLSLRGTATHGVLFDRWQEAGEGRSRSFIAFAFMAPDRTGEPQPITCAVESELAYGAMTIGERVRVRYMPGRPTLCELLEPY